MNQEQKLIVEIMQLAYLVQANTSYCVFIDYSGHVESLGIRICESKERWQNELLKTEFYTEHSRLVKAGNPLAYLEAKRNILAQIINEQGIPYEECEVEKYIVEDYSF